MARISALLLIAVALAPVAAAQGPTTPTANVSIEDMPDTMQEVPVGGAAEVAFNVNLRFQGVVCPQASTATVQLTLDAGPPVTGFSIRLSQTELTFEVPVSLLPFSGNQGPPAQEVKVVAEADAGVAPALHKGVNVTATYAGGTPSGCQAGATIPPDSETAPLMLMTGSADGGGPSGTSSPAPTSEAGGGGNGIPGPPVPLVLLAVALVVAVARRRR